MKEKIESIQKEITQFTDNIGGMANTFDDELNRFIFSLEQGQFKQ